ncbi:MAG: hypothetical protein U0Q03_05940 [Acidimicrobiales bacterium]
MSRTASRDHGRAPRPAQLARLLAAGLALMLVAACGGDDAPASSERPLTDDEAAMLAGALFTNYDRGGADVTLAVQVGNGASLSVQGEIDWSTHRGHALVSATGVETGVREVYWSDDAVLEARDDLGPLLAQAGLPDAPWVAREPDPAGRQLDQALALLTGLASQQRDNPLLIQQQPGSAFVRDDTLRGTPVVVLRYGDASVYWLSADDGRMLRFESNNSDGDRPVVVDVLGFRDVSVDGPPVDQVTDVADIAAVYAAALAAP